MEAAPALALALAVLASLATAPAAAPAEWHLVLYAGPVPADERAFLGEVAEEILDPVPPFGYLARLEASDLGALRARAAVAGVVDLADLPPASKAARDATGADRVRVLLFPDADRARVAEGLLAMGAARAGVPPAREPVLDVDLGTLSLARLLGEPAVRWVEPLRDVAAFDNERASSIVQGGSNAAWPVHARGLGGRSQLVAYCDSGLDTDAPLATGAGRAVHEMFSDLVPLAQNVPSPLHRKVALYYAPVEDGTLRGDLDDAVSHGTHVGGTLAGDAGVHGSRDGHDGVAFAARLVVCDAQRGLVFHVLSDYAGYWQPAYDAGARIHSNSWGTAPSDEYTLAARQHDAYAWEHRDFLILRSMGNGGPGNPMRPEAAAKNVLAIGATVNDADDERVADSSGRGPAADGRVKPDLVAPGRCVTSSVFQDATGYACWAGTSHATPVAAGAATLVRDYFARGFHPEGPRNVSSALLRAVLVAGAGPVASPAPDASEGWGRPELDDVLEFDGGGVDLLVHDEAAPLETSGTWATTLDVPAGRSLRVVLAWTDAPAAPGASPALVNDLDLEVITPGGSVLHGNADLAAPDRVNVVERLLVGATQQGTYTVVVRGWNVLAGPQPFGLVAVAKEG